MQLFLYIISTIFIATTFASSDPTPAWDFNLQLQIYNTNHPTVDYFPIHYAQKLITRLAAANGRLDVVKYRIEKLNDNVDYCDSYLPKTPLALAAEHSHLNIVNYLLSKNAHVNKNGNDSFVLGSALHFACMQSNMEIIKILLKHGANLNAKDGWGMTPLETAAYYYNLDAIKLLLKYRPKCSEINCKYLFNMHHPAILQIMCHLLLYGIYIRGLYKDDSRYPQSFKVAANRGFINFDENDPENIKLAQITDENGDTAVMYAVTQNKNRTLVWLLDHGGRIFAKNKDGHNAIEYVNRILSREDITGETRVQYEGVMHILCKTYLYRNQFFNKLPVPREIAEYIKSYC